MAWENRRQRRYYYRKIREKGKVRDACDACDGNTETFPVIFPLEGFQNAVTNRHTVTLSDFGEL